MNCTEFELAAQERLDSRQPELTDELRAHCAACPACESFWNGQLTLLAAVNAWPAAAPPPGLIDAVLADLSRPAVQPARAGEVKANTFGGFIGTICSTAALALLAVALVRQTATQPAPDAALVQTEPISTPVVPDEPIVTQTLAGLWHGMQVEYAELSEETSQALDRWSEFPEAALPLPLLPRGESSGDSPDASWPRWDRPVSERVGEAFDFLWDALPRPRPRSS